MKQRRISARKVLGGAIFLILIMSLFPITGCSTSASATPLPSIKPWREETKSKPSSIALAKSEPDPDGVDFLGVGFAMDGSLIMLNFKARPETVHAWMQGSVYVVDEKTGALFNDIPVAPLLGPLIGRPQVEGQLGYVMLVNKDAGIKSGSIVTVVLGNYKREHIQVP